MGLEGMKMQSSSSESDHRGQQSAPVVSDAFIDESVERILRAAGSSLRHYMPSSKDDLRKAMRGVLASAREAQP